MGKLLFFCLGSFCLFFPFMLDGFSVSQGLMVATGVVALTTVIFWNRFKTSVGS